MVMELRDEEDSASASPTEAKGMGRLWHSVGVITLQSFLTGYSIVALNPAMVMGSSNSAEACYSGEDSTCPPGSIYRDIPLTTVDSSLATSLLIAGGAIGALLSGRPMDNYGRRLTLLYNDLLFIVGTSLCCFFTTKGTLFAGRLVSGIGMGFSSVAVPVLLSEIAEDRNRGVVTIMHQGMITLGILVGGLVPLGLVSNVSQGWRYCQGLAFVPALLVYVGQHLIPESPKWLIGSGRSDEATSILKSLRGISEYEIESEILTLSTEAEAQASAKPVSWSEIFSNPEPVVIGCALNFMQAFTGVNSVVMYSTTIFGFAGFNDSILATGLFGIVNFSATMISANITDRYGRKVLLLSGTCIMFVSLVALSSSLLGGEGGAIAVIAVISVLTYISGFAIGLGAVVWPMLSELMRSRVRGKAVSLFLGVNWCSNFVVAMCTLLAINSLGGVTDSMTDEEASIAKKNGVGYLYLVFSCVTFVSVVYIAVKVPETKGKVPEDFIKNEERAGLLDKSEA